MQLKILIVEDHPSMIEGYKVILSYNELGYEIQSTTAHNCQTAFELITNKHSLHFFDVIFLDYTLPAFEEQNIFNGQDLAVLAKKFMPQSKIVVLTSHTESILLYNIFKQVNPVGLLVKSDFTADELLVAFGVIMKNENYYSETAKKVIKELSSEKGFLDKVNKQIILLISQGIKTIDIPKYTNLSLSAVEKRKTFIRECLGIPKGNDAEIIKQAKKLHLI